jgi:hypothetical protein
LSIREDRPQHGSADKRTTLRDHYLFRTLGLQHIDRPCIVIIARASSSR